VIWVVEGLDGKSLVPAAESKDSATAGEEEDWPVSLLNVEGVSPGWTSSERDVSLAGLVSSTGEETPRRKGSQIVRPGCDRGFGI
jgi:hypothetical protein